MLVFTFPGQGSQRPGMGAPWTDHPSWELVADATEAVDRDVAHLLLDADQEELTQTRNAQLACFTLSMVVLDAVERTGLAPVATAGHSLGEYSALVAVGALAFEDGVRLVAERGEAMQLAAEDRPGTMAAILGLDVEQCWVACRRADAEVWVANDNAPGQVVLSGSPANLDGARDDALAKGLRALPLGVAGAFHSPQMQGAVAPRREALRQITFHETDAPVISCATAAPFADPAAELAEALVSPVRWRETMGALADAGARSYLDPGPGAVLAKLAPRCVPGAQPLELQGAALQRAA